MPTNSDEDVVVRKASGRTDSQTVRLSLPANVVDKLDITAGDNIAIIITEEEEVRLVSLESLVG